MLRCRDASKTWQMDEPDTEKFISKHKRALLSNASIPQVINTGILTCNMWIKDILPRVEVFQSIFLLLFVQI